MKKKLFIFPSLLLSATVLCVPIAVNAATPTHPDQTVVQDPDHPKTDGNNDFAKPGNLITADFAIDGVLDNPEWDDACLVATMGNTDTVKSSSTAKVYFGEKGLTIGFQTLDTRLEAFTDYSDPDFVVNSDNVEFYICTQNDKAEVTQKDDYAFLVNPLEHTELRVGTGSYWGPWSGVIDYGCKPYGTVNNDDDVDTGWGCEIFLPYSSFGFTKESTVAIAFGMRDRNNVGDLKSEWCGWGSKDPGARSGPSTYVSINKNGVVSNLIGDQDNLMELVSGTYKYDKDTKEFTSKENNSIALAHEKQFTVGTISCDMYLKDITIYDNGLVFQVNTESPMFWEEKGVSYYTFLINRDGNGLLGRIDDGVWTSLGDGPCDYKEFDWNKIEVSIDEEGVLGCFVNDELVVTYTLPEVELLDARYGFRSGQADIKFKNLTYSSTPKEIVTLDIPGYVNARGKLAFVDETKANIHATQLNGGAIAYNSTKTLSKGSVSTKITPKEALTDNGIIFCLDRGGKTSFWEDAGVSYYFFFINRDGNAYLGKVNSGWNECGCTAIPDFDVNTEYTLKVVYNSSKIIGLVNGVQLISYTRPASDISGTEYGYRCASLQTLYTLIVTTDEDIPESSNPYVIANGNFTYDKTDKIQTSATANALAYDNDHTFSQGTLTTYMQMASLSSDNGIIFQLTNSSTSFWEGIGTKYYFMFINALGECCLGLTDNGSWSFLGSAASTFAANQWNKIEISLNNGQLAIFINDACLLVKNISVTASAKFGIRAGKAGVQYKEFEISATPKEVDVDTIDNYSLRSGTFKYTDATKTKVKANNANSLMTNTTETFTSGTLSMKMTPNGSSDSGLIFCVNENGKTSYWEDGVSYYFFFINVNGEAYLGRVQDGWTQMGAVVPIENFSQTKEYEIKVTISGSSINCYIDNVLKNTQTNTLDGTKFGVRMGSNQPVFTLPTKE